MHQHHHIADRCRCSAAAIAFCLALALACGPRSHAARNKPQRHQTQQGDHTSNWAVIVSTSRYWFNYRHASDALSFYHIVRGLGIPDSNIILMLPDDYACSPRNPFPGQIFNNKDHRVNLYGEKVEVDYRGYEVTVENFLRVLTGRHAPGVPRSKRLLSDSGSNLLVFLAGHGGDDFLKFQDQEEMMGQDIADAIAQMHEKVRYRQMLLFLETCEAEPMTRRIYSPNVMTVATSKLGEKSYSHHTDMAAGLTITDRVTYYGLQWFANVGISSNATLQQFLDFVGSKELDSTLVWDASRFPRPPSQVPIMDFFGSVPRVVASADGGVQSAAGASAGDTGGGSSSNSTTGTCGGGSVGGDAAAQPLEAAALAPIASEKPWSEFSVAEAVSEQSATKPGGVVAGWEVGQPQGGADFLLLLSVAATLAAAALVSRRSQPTS